MERHEGRDRRSHQRDDRHDLRRDRGLLRTGRQLLRGGHSRSIPQHTYDQLRKWRFYQFRRVSSTYPRLSARIASACIVRFVNKRVIVVTIINSAHRYDTRVADARTAHARVISFAQEYYESASRLLRIFRVRSKGRIVLNKIK